MGEVTPKLATIHLHPCQHNQHMDYEYQHMDYEYQPMDYENHMKNLSAIL